MAEVFTIEVIGQELEDCSTLEEARKRIEEMLKEDAVEDGVDVTDFDAYHKWEEKREEEFSDSPYDIRYKGEIIESYCSTLYRRGVLDDEELKELGLPADIYDN